MSTVCVTLDMFFLTCVARHKFSTHNVPSNIENKKLKPEINSPWCFNCYCSCFAFHSTCDHGDVLLSIRYGSAFKSRRKFIGMNFLYSSCCKFKTGCALSGLYYCLALVIWADRNGRCCWTRNSHWPIFPFTFHSYT